MCIRAVNTCYCVFNSLPNKFKTQEFSNKAVDDNNYALGFVADRYKTQ